MIAASTQHTATRYYSVSFVTGYITSCLQVKYPNALCKAARAISSLKMKLLGMYNVLYQPTRPRHQVFAKISGALVVCVVGLAKTGFLHT